jgi:hypothetical protein
LGAPFNADPSPEDLFRYDASGARSFSTNACTGAPAAYLSLDGTNRLAQFNNCDDGGDYADWQSSPLPKGLNPEVQDAFGIPGTNPALTNASPEVVALDAIGYNVATVPEPSAFAPALLGFGLLVLFARKRAANR